MASHTNKFSAVSLWINGRLTEGEIKETLKSLGYQNCKEANDPSQVKLIAEEMK